MRVFLLEDDFSFRLKLVKSFIKNGCEVVAHVSDASRESFTKAISSYIDLFVLDIELLSDEKAGFEFAKKLYQQNKSVQLVYLTSRKEFLKEAFKREEYPVPYDFLSKNRIFSDGYDEVVNELITKFSAHQPPSVEIDNKKVFINDIMFVEIPYKGILHIYLKDGKFIPLETALKNLENPQSQYYIKTLTRANKNLLVNGDFIVDAEKDKAGEAPTTLVFRTTKGTLLTKETSVKNGVEFYKKYRKK